MATMSHGFALPRPTVQILDASAAETLNGLTVLKRHRNTTILDAGDAVWIKKPVKHGAEGVLNGNWVYSTLGAFAQCAHTSSNGVLGTLASFERLKGVRGSMQIYSINWTTAGSNRRELVVHAERLFEFKDACAKMGKGEEAEAATDTGVLDAASLSQFELWKATVAALPAILEECERRGVIHTDPNVSNVMYRIVEGGSPEPVLVDWSDAGVVVGSFACCTPIFSNASTNWFVRTLGRWMAHWALWSLLHHRAAPWIRHAISHLDHINLVGSEKLMFYGHCHHEVCPQRRVEAMVWAMAKTVPTWRMMASVVDERNEPDMARAPWAHVEFDNRGSTRSGAYVTHVAGKRVNNDAFDLVFNAADRKVPIRINEVVETFIDQKSIVPIVVPEENEFI